MANKKLRRKLTLKTLWFYESGHNLISRRDPIVHNYSKYQAVRLGLVRNDEYLTNTCAFARRIGEVGRRDYMSYNTVQY